MTGNQGAAMSKTIGILGGMGPEATIYFFNLIVKATRAEKDQDHITSIVFNNPKIPDRTHAIVGNGPSPLPYLIAGAKMLETAGADFIVMPCVTAHYFYGEIVKHISIPFLHLLTEVLRCIKRELGNIKKIGLLATDGTIQSGLFQDVFNKNGIEVAIPEDNDQKVLMKALYREKGVKAGYKRHPKKMILGVLGELLQEQQPEGIIAGCTEIPLVLKQADMDVPFIEPLRILAEASIRKAGYQLGTR
jgi:aspartate racemase